VTVGGGASHARDFLTLTRGGADVCGVMRTYFLMSSVARGEAVAQGSAGALPVLPIHGRLNGMEEGGREDGYA
jgi:hypothetical protein